MTTPVSFELAKLLKEKGFNEKVRGRYCIKKITPFKVGLFYLSDYELSENFIYAPTIAEVVMWLYEKYNIWISVLQMLNNGERVTWYASYYEKGVGEDIDVYYNSPTKAYEAAIEYTLKNLITNN